MNEHLQERTKVYQEALTRIIELEDKNAELLEALKQKESSMRYLFEMLFGWLIGKRNGGEYFIMEDEK